MDNRLDGTQLLDPWVQLTNGGGNPENEKIFESLGRRFKAQSPAAEINWSAQPRMLLLHIQRSNCRNTKIITEGSRPELLALLDVRSYKNTTRDESFGIADPLKSKRRWELRRGKGTNAVAARPSSSP